MITKENEEKVKAIIEFIDRHTSLEEGKVDWEKVRWIDTLNTMVACLKIAPESYKECNEEDTANYFYTAECGVCGWWGSSKFLNGGGAIADTGDHFECTCPVCDSMDVNEKSNN
jgi:hypothetical protein